MVIAYGKVTAMTAKKRKTFFVFSKTATGFVENSYICTKIVSSAHESTVDRNQPS